MFVLSQVKVRYGMGVRAAKTYLIVFLKGPTGLWMMIKRKNGPFEETPISLRDIKRRVKH